MSDEQLLIYNTHLTQNWYVYALGADKTKWLMKHTATITKVKIDHTKRQLLTHRPPPRSPHSPISTATYNRRYQNQGTAKDKQI